MTRRTESMNRKILVAGMIGLSLSLLVACGDKTNTQEPTNEADRSVIQQSEPQAQAMEVKQEIPAESTPTETEEPANQEEAPTEDDTLDEIDLFAEVEETVYAISAVNIRASWSTDSDKLGSLTSGDSVTRIGIGIAGTEAEIWSKVVLPDGSIAYAGSSYLSTTKPATQQQQTQQTQTQPQQQEQQAQSGLTPEMEEHNRQMREQAEQQKQGTGEHGYSTREWTDEEAKRAVEQSGKIYRGEEQLQQAEDGTFYFYY